MSGLGIDFGSNEIDMNSSNHHHTTSQQRSDRFTLLPKKSSMHKLRHPKTSDERLEARRVRIASGEPGILGHGAYTEQDFLSPPSATCSSISDGYAPSAGRTTRLSAAVAAMSDSSSISSALQTHSSTTDGYSPSTQTSLTSFSSAGSSNNSRRSKTMKKQASQPQLSRTLTTRTRDGVATASAASNAMGRSKSTINLSSAYKSDGGSSSLGRSSEISRGASRNATARGSYRGTSRGRGGGRPSYQQGRDPRLNQSGQPQVRAITVSDGLGGLDRSGNATENTPQGITPSSINSGNGSAYFDGPSLLSRISIEEPVRAPSVASSHSQTSSSASREKQWRVGTFYGVNGQETGRLDAEGILSSAGSAVPSESGSTLLCPESVSSQSSLTRPRSMSSLAPRAHMMASPAQPIPQGSQAELVIGSENSTKTAANIVMRRAKSSASMVSMRSRRGLKGLEGAETGEAMVSLDNYAMGYETGVPILLETIQTNNSEGILLVGQSGSATGRSESSLPTLGLSLHERSMSESGTAATIRNRPSRNKSDATASGTSLERNGTLISNTANPMRRSKELNRLLGNSGRKLAASAASATQIVKEEMEKGKSGLQRSNAIAGNLAPPAVLEQGKAGKARVEVDLVLESDLAVEGGTVRGRIQIKVRKGSEKEGAVMLAQPKVRVVGFEELLNDDTRHIFYHHASVIDGDRTDGAVREPYYLHGSPTFCSPEARANSSLGCFASAPDAEGYAVGREGTFDVPFRLELPISKGAKGSYKGKNAVVRYIVIGSVKLKSSDGTNRSIAHFYRHIELFPYLNPAVVLSSAPKPIQATTSKGLFLGGSGKVQLTASLHRSTWVAGQRVYVNVAVQNDTSKKVNSMALALIRTVTLYRPRPELDMSKAASDGFIDPDACQTSTSRKKITEEALEMGQKGTKGVVTARGWWTGVEPGGGIDFSHYMELPNDALSISRGRHVEVTYSIKVSVGSSLSSDVFVDLPLRIVNFVSLDPPPTKNAASGSKFATAEGSLSQTQTWSHANGGGRTLPSSSHPDGEQGPLIARVKSMDALRSPAKGEVSLHGYNQLLPPDASGQVQQAGPGLQVTRSRQLQHQKSLDFINHAIRSATARRGLPSDTIKTGDEPSPMGLGIGICENLGSPEAEESSDDEQDDGDLTPTTRVMENPHAAPLIYPPGCSPFELKPSLPPLYEGLGLGMGVGAIPAFQLNNREAVTLDEVGDDYDQINPNQTLGLNDESVDEVDMVIGSTQLDQESPYSFDEIQHYMSEDPDLSGSIDDSLVPEYYTGADGGSDEEGCNEPDMEKEQLASNSGWSLRRRSEDSGSEEEEKSDTRRTEQGSAAVSTKMSHLESLPIPPNVVAPLNTNKKVTTPTVNAINGTPRQIQATVAKPMVRSATSSRPSSPVKTPSLATLGSPSKSSVKSKTGFGFATANSPLKINKEKVGLPEQPVLRAKASVNSFQKETPKPTAAATKPPSLIHRLSESNLAKHADSFSKRTPSQGSQVSKRSKNSRGKRQPKGKTSRRNSPSNTPPSDHSPSSPESNDGVKTPESTCTELPTHIEEQDLAAGVVEKPVSWQAGQAKVKVLPMSPQRVNASSPGKPSLIPRSETFSADLRASPGTTLRHSQSANSLHSLPRSHSTHNLRGTAIMVPSVRNKIAMLENRSQTLKDFTGVTRPSSSTTPSRAPTSGASTPIAGGTPGRVAQITASAEKTRHQLTCSPARLTRKTSMASVASSEASASVPPDYLRRTNSMLSFKAPVLRNVRE